MWSFNSVTGDAVVRRDGEVVASAEMYDELSEQLESAATQRESADLQQRLQAFEALYQMPSADFYRRFRAGELGDSADFVEWSVFYEMWESVRERLQILEAEAA